LKINSLLLLDNNINNLIKILVVNYFQSKNIIIMIDIYFTCCIKIKDDKTKSNINNKLYFLYSNKI